MNSDSKPGSKKKGGKLYVEGMEALVEEGPTGKIISLKEVDSTNDVATALAEKNYPHGTVVVADSQRKGRGRLGRRWHSPAGKNIYMSVILRPSLEPDDAPVLTFLTAVSCAAALRKAAGVDVRIKWPNDLLSKDKKLGGILLEARSERGKVLFVVAGMGINVNSGEEDFPPDMMDSATSLSMQCGKGFDRGVLIKGILDEMSLRLKVLETGDRASVLKEWKALSNIVGADVEVISTGATVRGKVISIDNKGRLVLKTLSGELRIITAGDVSVLRLG